MYTVGAIAGDMQGAMQGAGSSVVLDHSAKAGPNDGPYVSLYMGAHYYHLIMYVYSYAHLFILVLLFL